MRRSKTSCCSKVGINRGPWTATEDEILAKFVQKEGEGHWRTLPKRAGLKRCGMSCRLRWMNYLRPSVKKGSISPDGEDLILRLHRLLGNRWALIAGRIPGRTDNDIKNYWNTHLSKKLIRQGIDPRTHKPLIMTNTAATTSSNANISNSQKVNHESNTTSNPHPIPQTIATPTLEIGSSSSCSQANTTTPSAGNKLDYQNTEGHGTYSSSNRNDDYDTFLLFLDSFISDNEEDVTHQQLQADAVFPSSLHPITPSEQPFNLSDWEAEFRSSALNGQNGPPFM